MNTTGKKSEHTELPWRAEDSGQFGDYNIIPDGQRLAVAVAVQNGLMLPEEVKANAELIVTAVNERPALLSRLREAEEALEWISEIATKNYEQDEKLRSVGARTLKRIADKARTALTQENAK